MKPIRILTSLAVIGVSIYCYNAYQNRPNALAQRCLLETDGRTAVDLCKTALLSDDLLPNERGDVAFGIGYLLHYADPAQAIEYYSKAAAVYPEKTTAFHNRGMLLLEADDYDAAIADLTVAIDRMEAGGRVYDYVYWRRAHAYDVLGSHDLALADYAAQIADTPDDARLYSNSAEIHRERGDLETAVQFIDKAIAISPTDPKVITKYASILGDQEDFTTLARVLTDAVTLHPNNAWMWRQKSWAEGKIELFEEALNSVDQAMVHGSISRWTWSQRGWVLTKLDRDVEAYAAYSKAHEINPNHTNDTTAFRKLVTRLKSHSEAQGAEIAFGPFLAAYPQDELLLLLAAGAFVDEKNYVDGLAHCAAAAALADFEYLCKAMQVKANLEDENHAAAITELDWVIAYTVPEGAAETALLDVIKVRDDDAARARAERELKMLREVYAEAVQDRANSHVALGNVDAALADHDTLVDLSPEDPDRRLDRARAMIKFGQDVDAIPDLTIVIERLEETGDQQTLLAAAFVSRSKSHYRAGKILAAFEDMKRGLGDDAILIRKMQSILAKNGRYSGGTTGVSSPEFNAALRACFFDTACGWN